MKVNIFNCPCDKVLFPSCGFYDGVEEWREETTFFRDFKIAELYGVAAVKDTFERSFAEWNKNAKYICELAVVTNHLCWMADSENKKELSTLYSTMYYKCYDTIFQADDDGKNISPFSDEEVSTIYKVLD